ncbi:MAG: hypothetical protein IPH28_25185 [Cytophagaceae bacterium]|nr:hypothetical protein [Cytophagaceae bacterium]
MVLIFWIVWNFRVNDQSIGGVPTSTNGGFFEVIHFGPPLYGFHKKN